MSVHWTAYASLLDGIDELFEQLPAGVRRQELQARAFELRVQLHRDVRAEYRVRALMSQALYTQGIADDRR
jgi:hypothetical protein